MQVQIVDVRPWDADGLVTLKPLRHQPKSWMTHNENSPLR
jgi:hypothetical protein